MECKLHFCRKLVFVQLTLNENKLWNTDYAGSAGNNRSSNNEIFTKKLVLVIADFDIM